MLRVKSSRSKNYSNVSLPAKMEKIYGMHKLVELQLFWSRTPTFSSGTPTFCQMGVLNSCFQNLSVSSEINQHCTLMVSSKNYYTGLIMIRLSL